MTSAVDWVDTVDKGKAVVFSLQYPSAYDRVTSLIELCPDVIKLSHRIIGELLGLQRETVTRTMLFLGYHRRKR